MTLPTRTIEPTAFVAGERVEWTRSFEDYPASAWGLVYKIRGPGVGIDVTASADGDDFVATIIPTLSDDLVVAGKYRMQGVVTQISDTSEKFVVFDGFVNVTLALATATTILDFRTPAKIMLDAIDAALLAFATGDVQEYEISTPAGMRRVKRGDKAQLLEQRKYWASIVQQEQAKERVRNGGSFGQQIGVRFRG